MRIGSKFAAIVYRSINDSRIVQHSREFFFRPTNLSADLVLPRVMLSTGEKVCYATHDVWTSAASWSREAREAESNTR